MTTEPNDLPAVPISIDDIVQAARRLEPWAHRTPVLTSRTLDERSGASVFLKCENLQRVGAFKFRGAMNALLLLDQDQKAAGVVTHSSGNLSMTGTSSPAREPPRSSCLTRPARSTS